MPSQKNVKRRAAVAKAAAAKAATQKTQPLTKETILYEERVPLGLKWLAVLLAAIGVLVWALVISLMSPTRPEPIGIVVLGGIIAGFLLIMWNFRHLTIQMTTQELLVQFGRFNKMVVKRKSVSDCEPLKKVKMTRFPAIGPRSGLDGSRGYLTSHGTAVELTRYGDKAFIFSSRRPEEVCAAIERYWGK